MKPYPHIHLTPFQQVVYAGVLAIYLRNIHSNLKRAQRIAYQIAVKF